MRRLGFLLSVIVCCGLAIGIGLVACGDEDSLDCNAVCLKDMICDGDGIEGFLSCVNGCNTAPQDCKDCVKDCDLNMSCSAFDACKRLCPNCPK